MQGTSCCFHPSQPLVYVAAGASVYSYDWRVDKIIIDEVKDTFQAEGNAEINEVRGIYLLPL